MLLLLLCFPRVKGVAALYVQAFKLAQTVMSRLEFGCLGQFLHELYPVLVGDELYNLRRLQLANVKPFSIHLPAVRFQKVVSGLFDRLGGFGILAEPVVANLQPGPVRGLKGGQTLLHNA